MLESLIMCLKNKGNSAEDIKKYFQYTQNLNNLEDLHEIYKLIDKIFN